jgi:K+-transporting ATPase ATPase C chain
MKKHLLTAVLYTGWTALLLGIVYPVAVTGAARMLFSAQANGQLITKDGAVIGSRLIGQPFSDAKYFHGRPSAAGAGYDASASSGSNFAPTSKALVNRVGTSVAAEQGRGDVPVDLVAASGSGLDPEISPAAAIYQVSRVASSRGLAPEKVLDLVRQHIQQRQFGLLGEPRVNVLELNLALDAMAKP